MNIPIQQIILCGQKKIETFFRTFKYIYKMRHIKSNLAVHAINAGHAFPHIKIMTFVTHFSYRGSIMII